MEYTQMSMEERVTSGCYFVWFRGDMQRADCQAYWRGPHGQIANKIPAMNEYLQHHFSQTDHGFWPVPQGVGGDIPPDWRMDGFPEVRIKSFIASITSRLFHVNAIFHDEQNVFDRVLAKMTRPGGGMWWTGPYKPDIGFRAVVLVRVRHEYRGAPFRRFIEATLAPALMDAGARELRTHVFQKGSRFTHWTPNVGHDEPANRDYACALIIGSRDRVEFDRLLDSTQVSSTQPAQKRHCVAIHAYAVENTYPLVLNGKSKNASWD